MNVYHIQEDGEVSHWVAADTVVAALQFLFTATDVQDECESLSVDLLSGEKAQKILIDDDGAKRTLADLASECKEPSYLACSEY